MGSCRYIGAAARGLNPADVYKNRLERRRLKKYGLFGRVVRKKDSSVQEERGNTVKVCKTASEQTSRLRGQCPVNRETKVELFGFNVQTPHAVKHGVGGVIMWISFTATWSIVISVDQRIFKANMTPSV